MARAMSLNFELHLGAEFGAGANIIRPSSIGEFGEGEEGRIDVADGDRKYKIRDQIYAIDEIPVTILIKDDLREYDAMQEWCTSGEARTVWLVGKGAGRDQDNRGGLGREEVMVYQLTNCQCAMGKKNAFDRQSKTFDSKTYHLLPEYVDDITSTSSHAIY